MNSHIPVNHEQATSSSTHRVYAVGSYGFGNFGDELFAQTVIENRRQIWPEARVRVFLPSVIQRAYANSGPIGKIVRLAVTASGTIWSTTIALCGGSILQDVTGNAALRQKLAGNRDFEALGVSIGPFRSSSAEQRVATLLHRSKRTVVRDRASIERYRKLDSNDRSPVIGGDLAGLSHKIRTRSHEQNVVTVCPSAMAGVSPEVLARQITEGVEELEHRFGTRIKIRLLALSSHPNSNDEAIIKHAAPLVRRAGIQVTEESFKALGVRGTCDILASSLMVWSQRLHGAIVAYLAGRPFILVGHHPKCIDFCEDIGQTSALVDNVRESWSQAINAQISSTSDPRLTPSAYRRRARNAYFPQSEAINRDGLS